MFHCHSEETVTYLGEIERCSTVNIYIYIYIYIYTYNI